MSKAKISIVTLAYTAITAVALNFDPLHFVDIEAHKYGEIAAAFLYDYRVILSLDDFLYYPRYEGSLFIFSPIIALGFFFFGKSLYTLNLIGVFTSSLLIPIWFLIFAKVYPNINKKILAISLLFPLPLIINAALSITSIMTHIGSLLFYGIILLFITFFKCEQKGKQLIFSSLQISLLILVGYLYHPMFVTLYPSCLYLIYKKNNRLFFYIVTLISTTGIGLITLLHAPSASSTFIAPQEFFTNTTELLLKLQYLPGTQVPSMDSNNQTAFLPTLWVYIFLIFMGLLLKWKGRTIDLTLIKKQDHNLQKTLILSSISVLLFLSLTEYQREIRPVVFDGLRYFLFLSPTFYLFLLYPANHLKRPLQKTYLGSLLTINTLSFILFLFPFKFNETLHEYRGYLGMYPLYQKNFDSTKLKHAKDKDVLIPWYGMRNFIQNGLDKSLKLTPSWFTKEDKFLYLVGVGMGQNINSQYSPLGLSPIYGDIYAHNHRPNFGNILKGNCLIHPKGCPIKENDFFVTTAIKTGWLVTTPCTGIEKAIGAWPAVVKNHWHVLWSKPDLTECPIELDFPYKKDQNYFHNINKTVRLDGIFPLTATSFRKAKNNKKKHTPIFGDWGIWSEYFLKKP